MKLRQKLSGLKNRLKKSTKRCQYIGTISMIKPFIFYFFCCSLLFLVISVFIMLFRYHMVDMSDSERKYIEFVFEHFMI